MRASPGDRRQRLGLSASATSFHRPRRTRQVALTAGALRSLTSHFRFPMSGRFAGHRARRTTLPTGLSRAPRG